MNDLISRQAAINALDDYILDEVTDSRGDSVREILEKLPSAQPERIPGKWAKISPAGVYECSVCGQNVLTQDIDVYAFCHGCGAKMEVVSE